ncbi:hypothetical protein NM688_g3087 [Phlebia brevispora]|uniref:Uncharacterized protein n=1 Tax=Phlebia brevispora TaxID=194682 RepID=A0ACC1T6V4_9APHY|nr:hypothetical protein NM688_g3087 [Phlebia brevispora]
MQSTEKLSEQTIVDVIELQGKEIARLRKELAQLTTRHASLQAESLRLKRASQPLVIPYAENVANDDELNTDPPTYKGVQIASFSDGNSKIFKTARKTIGGRTGGTLNARQNFIWLGEYESGIALRPSARLTKKGKCLPDTNKKVMQRNAVITRIGSRWYYLGQYEYVSSEEMSPDEFLNLPTALQQDLISLSGGSKHRQELTRKFSTGEIAVIKFHLHRVAFDNAIQNALMQVKAAELGLLGVGKTGDGESGEGDDASGKGDGENGEGNGENGEGDGENRESDAHTELPHAEDKKEDKCI